MRFSPFHDDRRSGPPQEAAGQVFEDAAANEQVAGDDERCPCGGGGDVEQGGGGLAIPLPEADCRAYLPAPTPVGGWPAVVFGAPVTVVGLAVTLMGLGVMSMGGLPRDLKVIVMFANFVGGPSIAAWGVQSLLTGLTGMRYRRRAQALFAEAGADMASVEDHQWSVRRVRSHEDCNGGKQTLTQAFHSMAARVKFGQTHLRLEQFPYVLGEMLHVVWEVGRAIENYDRIVFTLRCLEWVDAEEASFRLVNESNHGCHQLWAETFTIEGPGSLPAGSEAPISFLLPEDVPATRLREQPMRYWRLEITAESPGVSFRGIYPLPVYGPEEDLYADAQAD